MKRIKKGEIIVYGLALMLVTAGYFNYISFERGKETQEIVSMDIKNNEDKDDEEFVNVGDAVLVNNNEIEENDERNIALRDRAEAKAYRIMLPVFGALLFAFGLMNVELRIILLLVAAYLFICGCSIFYSVKYRKEM